jgi:hypothetical protein
MAGLDSAEHDYQPLHLARSPLESEQNTEDCEYAALQEGLATLAEDVLDLADMPEDGDNPPVRILEISPDVIAYDMVDYCSAMPGRTFVERVVGAVIVHSPSGDLEGSVRVAYYRGVWRREWHPLHLRYAWRKIYVTEPLSVDGVLDKKAIGEHRDIVKAEINRRATLQRRRYMLGKQTLNLL